MDHLAIPLYDLANPALQVPFLCNDRFSYDDWGFLTYPYRAGVDLTDLTDKEMRNPDSLAPFVQAWLWFGLIGELLYIGSRPDREQKITSYMSFIQRDTDGKQIVCTTNLYKYILEASKWNKAIRQDDFYQDRFNACMERAKEAVGQILSSPTCRRDLEFSPQFTDLSILYTVILSVQVLIEALDTSRHLLLPQRGSILYTPAPQPFHSQLVDTRLRDAGWSASGLPESFRLRYYLSFFRPYSIHPDRGPSNMLLQITKVEDPSWNSAMQPRHATTNCHCQSVIIERSHVANIISAYNILLLTFPENPGGGPRRLRLIESSLEQGQRIPGFIAISHVRRAGLGNSAASALPGCQLFRMQEWAGDISGSSQLPLFWIDTMCRPRKGSSFRGRSIEEAFESAEKVLVLDPSLYHHCVGSCEEALVRIRYSLWKSRLWTLQEGTLAKQLYFRFLNKTVNLDELVETYEREQSFPLLERRDFDGVSISRQWLKPVLQLLADDIKPLRGKDPESHHGLSHEKLCKSLRLGYLACPRYRYFIEDHEMAGIPKVLGALADVYLHPQGMPLRARERKQKDVIEGLRRLQSVHE